MAERSYYWGGTTLGDATLAEYTDDEFSDRWAELFTIDRTTQGVIYTELVGYTGLLEVTKVDDDNVAMDTGIAMVDGKVYENDALLNLGVGGDGFYRIVLRKTWATQVVRAIILGPQAVAPPNVTQTDGTTWEISLATFEKAAGVIGAVTDTRVYINAEIKRRFVAPLTGRNVTDATDIVLTYVPGGPVTIGACLTFPDSKICHGEGRFCMPPDVISDLALYAVIVSNATGNIYGRNQYEAGECGEQINTHSGSAGYSAVALAAGRYECILDPSPANLGSQDIVELKFYRDGVDVLDTLGDSVFLTGWIVEYFGRKTGGS